MQLLPWFLLILLLAFSQFVGILIYKSFEKTCNRIKDKFFKMAIKQAAKNKPVISAAASGSVEDVLKEMPEIKVIDGV